MSEWLGETGDEELSHEQRAIRKCVIRLVEEGGCSADIAQSAVTELAEYLRQ